LKANPNPEIVRLVQRHGLSVVAVSGFEIRLALDLGFPGNRIFFNGNGKQRWEMRLAAENDCIMNVDSIFNARQLVKVVEDLDKEIEVTIRLNVDIDTQVHPYLQTGENTKSMVHYPINS
jgi:diaminopimelate decarboxylase